MMNPPVPMLAVAPSGSRFSHDAAVAVARWALRPGVDGTIVLDLSDATDASTAAFAALVLLRRRLLRDGRDLRVTGLRGRVRHLYTISRLTDVLPDLDPAIEGQDAEPEHPWTTPTPKRPPGAVSLAA